MDVLTESSRHAKTGGLMSTIAKAGRTTAKPNRSFVTPRSNRPVASARGAVLRQVPSGVLPSIVHAAAAEDSEGNSGLDCLEMATRVLEIHYPAKPIAINMRRLIDDIRRFRAL
jgi:hypothetical protein